MENLVHMTGLASSKHHDLLSHAVNCSLLKLTAVLSTLSCELNCFHGIKYLPSVPVFAVKQSAVSNFLTRKVSTELPVASTLCTSMVYVGIPSIFQKYQRNSELMTVCYS